MKTIGLLGGMSWESTADYYRLINREVSSRCGGLHSAKISMVSVNFAEVETLMTAGDWDSCAYILTAAARNVESAGADCLLICTNTMHKLAPQVQAAISIPLLHIGDAAGKALSDRSIKTVGLLGTRFTMEEDFYKTRLKEKFTLTVLTPEAPQRKQVDDIIFHELCKGVIQDDSRKTYLDIMNGLREKGAEAILLGCTEIASLVDNSHTDIMLFDTTELHAKMAVDFSLDTQLP